MRTQIEENFSEFYDKWMSQLEDLLKLILVVSRERSQDHGGSSYYNHEAMVNKLTAHHKEYYTIKWASAHEDVLAFFSPVWLTPLQNAYLWVTGWKPSMAFQLLETLKTAPSGGSLAGMTEEQVKRIEALKVKIKVEEGRVEREMERQQVAMADRKMVELARLERVAKKSGGAAAVMHVNGLVEVAVKRMLDGLEKVMKMGDCARLKTLKGVLEVLTPMQSVEFLAAMSMLQIQMRKWGEKRNKCFSS